MSESRHKLLRRILMIVGIFICFMAMGIGIYLNDYYHADEQVNQYLQSTSEVTVLEENGTVAFIPDEYEKGLIFYPGGKVQYEAYAPILHELSNQNHVLCVLVHMPGNLAVLNADAADGIQEQYPEVTDWYIGGHSLGGAMAASYVADHRDEYEGLVLLGAYPTKDLTDSQLKLLSLYGSNDQVMKRDSYEANRANWPKESKEYVIAGGNHANFGMYGEQEGDGAAKITREQQWSETVEQIENMME